VDENLRPRSVLPEVGPVSSPILEYPNWKKRSTGNIYRYEQSSDQAEAFRFIAQRDVRGVLDAMCSDALFSLLGGDDERLVFGAASVLLSILKVRSLTHSI